MATELKGGLEVENAAAEAPEAPEVNAVDQGLTDEVLYPKTEEPKPAEKPKAEKAEPEEDDEPTGEEDKAWDKDRQRRDEERAEERRQLQGQVQTMAQTNAALTDELRALREGGAPNATAAEDREFEEALAQVDGLSDMSEPAEIAKAIKATKRLAVSAKGGGDRVARVEAALQAITEHVRALGEAVSAKQGRDDLETAMVALDSEYGPMLHNEAKNLAGELLLEQGRTKQNPPTIIEKKMALKLAYQQLAGKKAEKDEIKPGRPVRRPKLPSDAGSGGGLGAGTLKRGTLEEVAGDMAREGKLQ